MDFIGPLITVKHKGVDCRAVIVEQEKKNRTLAKVPDGNTVCAMISLKRDPGMHNRLFKMFSTTVANFPEGFTLPPDHFIFENNEAGIYSFRQWLKERLGFVRSRFFMRNGELVKEIEVRSLELDKCNTSDFEKFYYGARDFMASILKLDPIEFERQLFDI